MKIVTLLLAGLCCLPGATRAQKKPLLTNYDEVVARAKSDPNALAATA